MVLRSSIAVDERMFAERIMASLMSNRKLRSTDFLVLVLRK